MPTALRDVRSQEQSGKHLLAVSFSVFDPERTCPAIARSSAGTLPKSVCNLEMMSLPTSALAGERFTQTRTLH
jgi:hypothetical protein